MNVICKLFIEINNSEDLNQLINLINESFDKNEPKENIIKIIDESLLDNIIDKNYKKNIFNKIYDKIQKKIY